jgi:hypothetical protein
MLICHIALRPEMIEAKVALIALDPVYQWFRFGLSGAISLGLAVSDRLSTVDRSLKDQL